MAPSLVARSLPVQGGLEPALSSKKKATLSEFAVTIDYSKTLWEMAEAGNYVEHHGGLALLDYDVSKNGEGIQCRTLVLVKFSRQFRQERINLTEEFNELGLRPARLEEILAFGAQHPEVQLKHHISSAHDVPNRRGGFSRPLLWNGNKRGRMLDFFALDTPNRYDRFAQWVGIRYLGVRIES